MIIWSFKQHRYRTYIILSVYMGSGEITSFIVMSTVTESGNLNKSRLKSLTGKLLHTKSYNLLDLITPKEDCKYSVSTFNRLHHHVNTVALKYQLLYHTWIPWIFNRLHHHVNAVALKYQLLYHTWVP